MSHYRSECADCGEYAYLNDDARCETCESANAQAYADELERDQHIEAARVGL